jgi:hypothetical protein
MFPLTHPLTQPMLAAGESVLPVFGWSFVLIALLVGGYFAITKLREWMKADDQPEAIGFTLSDLRQLHRQGKMSDEEFNKAKSLILGNAKEMASKLPDPLARDRKPPNA